MFSGVRERVGKWQRDACLREDRRDKAVWFFTVVFVDLKKTNKQTVPSDRQLQSNHQATTAHGRLCILKSIVNASHKLFVHAQEHM